MWGYSGFKPFGSLLGFAMWGWAADGDHGIKGSGGRGLRPQPRNPKNSSPMELKPAACDQVKPKALSFTAGILCCKLGALSFCCVPHGLGSDLWPYLQVSRAQQAAFQTGACGVVIAKACSIFLKLATYCIRAEAIRARRGPCADGVYTGPCKNT